MKRTWNGEYPTYPTLPVDDTDLILLSHLSNTSIHKPHKEIQYNRKGMTLKISSWRSKATMLFSSRDPITINPRETWISQQNQEKHTKSKLTGRLNIGIKTQCWLNHLNRYLKEREREREREEVKEKKNE